MKTIVIVSILLIASLGGAAAFGLVRFKQENGKGQTFRVIYDFVVHKPDGSFHLQGRKVRYANRDGRRKEVFYDPEGKELRFNLNSFEGGFVGITDRQVISPTGPFEKPLPDTDEIVSKVASGTASILGYKVYVRKTKDGLTEIWTTPEIPNTPLKTIFRFAGQDGRQGYNTHEAVAIHWEHIADDVFKKPDWPINTFYLEDRIREAEHNKQDASEFKRELEKWKAKL